MDKEIIKELTSLSPEKRTQIIQNHISAGVLIPITEGVFIGENVQIEKNAVILPGTVLLGNTQIEKDCQIGPQTWLYNAKIKSGAALNNVQGSHCEVCENADIGPFVHIRPNSKICENVHLGNFVEVKNSTVGGGTKVSHLTYVGDSDVGKNVNFGCGCVTVNYDGKNKHRTKIGNNAFIGCNTNLIAPVEIGDFAYTAAGSTITACVPENALGIARAKQVNKENWVIKRKPYKNS